MERLSGMHHRCLCVPGDLAKVRELDIIMIVAHARAHVHRAYVHACVMAVMAIVVGIFD